MDGKVIAKDFNFSTLNKDSIQSVDVISADKKEKLDDLALKFGANTSNGVIIILTKQYARLKASEKVQTTDEITFDVVEKTPQFPGGDKALMSFIGKNLKYPIEAQKKGIQGKVIIRFVVLTTGKITRIEVLRDVSPALDNEAVRIVESFPDWIPGEQNGVKVNVHYTLPIAFRMD